MTSASEDEDEFWRLALEDYRDRPSFGARDVSHDAAEPSDVEGFQSAHRLKTYSLPSGIELTVSSLAESEGVMSPLGAQAWHASSLLAAYFILHNDTLFNKSSAKEDHHMRCLELGSGAVGLSGMALATVLSEMYPHASVLMTDLESEIGVLENLQENVKRNRSLYPNVDVKVEAVDWNDYIEVETIPESPLQPLDLVVGSELVYTEETAIACAGIVAHLLRSNPNLLVLIIQVTDRPGFETHFLPILQQDFDVRVEQPLDSDLHAAASGMVQLGGTLDRFAYGACWISNR